MVPRLPPPRDESKRSTPLLPTSGVGAESVFDLPYAVDDEPPAPPSLLPPPPTQAPQGTLPPPPTPDWPSTYSVPQPAPHADTPQAPAPPIPAPAARDSGPAPMPAPINAGPLAGSGIYDDDDTFGPDPVAELPPMVAKGGWNYFEDADPRGGPSNRPERTHIDRSHIDRSGPGPSNPSPSNPSQAQPSQPDPSQPVSARNDRSTGDLSTGELSTGDLSSGEADGPDTGRDPTGGPPTSSLPTSDLPGSVLAADAEAALLAAGFTRDSQRANSSPQSLIQRLSQATDGPSTDQAPSLSPGATRTPTPVVAPPSPLRPGALSFSPDSQLPDQPTPYGGQATSSTTSTASTHVPRQQSSAFATIQPLAPSPDPRQTRGPAVVVTETRIGDGLLVAAAAATVAGVIWWAVVALTQRQIVYVAVLLGILVGQAALVGGRRGSLGLGLVAGSLTLLALTATQYFISRSLFISEVGGEVPLWDGSSFFIDTIRATFEEDPLTALFVAGAAVIAGIQAGLPGRRASGPLGEIHASRAPDRIL